MKNTKFEDNLIFLLQGFGSSIFLNIKKNKIEPYATDMDSYYLYKNLSISPEGKRIMKKLYRLYGKIPKNYSNLKKISEEQFKKILLNMEESPGSYEKSEFYIKYVSIFVNENIRSDIEYDFSLYLQFIHKYVSDTMRDQYNKYIGSGFTNSKTDEIRNIIGESELKGEYVLKRYYKSEKKKINKYGLDYVLKMLD